MFADGDQLGYDTTMRRVAPVSEGQVAVTTQQDKDSEVHYDIAVRNEKGEEAEYRTVKVISNIGAEAARGRGTRVWQVRKIGRDRKPCGPIRVLKDCWIDDDRKREGDILAEIRKSAETDHKEQIGPLNEYFLTVECHGDVFIGQDLNNTHTLIRRNQDIPEDLGLYQLELPATQPNTNMLPVGSAPPEQRIIDNRQIVEYEIKSHYRIVFVGLKALHECGWVHRDISMGNILIVNNVPKISDLEYAKRVDDDSKVHLACTGTECFMPIEIKSQCFQFLPRNNADSDDDDSDDDSSDDSGADTATDPAAAMMAELGFLRAATHPLATRRDQPGNYSDVDNEEPVRKHIPLHDPEAFWWVTLILTICREILGISYDALTRSRAATLRGFVDLIFNDFDTRRRVMTVSKISKRGTANLPGYFLFAGSKLEEIRKLLVRTYRKAEANIAAVDHKVAPCTYAKIVLAYTKMARDIYSQGDFQLSSLHAKFLKPQEELAPPFGSLSLDSREIGHGKRTRDDPQDNVGVAPRGTEAETSSSGSVKRLRHDYLDPESNAMTSAEGAEAHGTGEQPLGEVRTNEETPVGDEAGGLVG